MMVDFNFTPKHNTHVYIMTGGTDTVK